MFLRQPQTTPVGKQQTYLLGPLPFRLYRPFLRAKHHEPRMATAALLSQESRWELCEESQWLGLLKQHLIRTGKHCEPSQQLTARRCWLLHFHISPAPSLKVKRQDMYMDSRWGLSSEIRESPRCNLGNPDNARYCWRLAAKYAQPGRLQNDFARVAYRKAPEEFWP